MKGEDFDHVFESLVKIGLPGRLISVTRDTRAVEFEGIISI